MPSPRRTLASFHLVVSGDGLSDLFFNHEHPQFDGLDPRGEDESEAEYYDRQLNALTNDADNFISCLCAMLGDVERVDLQEALVEDFLSRL